MKYKILLTILLLSSMVMASPYENYDYYYSFDSENITGNTIFEYSGTNANWTNDTQEIVTYTPYEFIGDSVSFTGDEYLRLDYTTPTRGGFLSDTNSTFAFWVKLDDNSANNVIVKGLYESSKQNVFGGANNETINDDSVGNYSGNVVVLEDNRGFIFQFYTLDIDSPTYYGDKESLYYYSDLESDKWYHVVVTNDYLPGGSTKLYVDGVLSDTYTKHTDGFGEFMVGGDYYIPPILGGFNGTYDELLVYKQILTQDQITYLYNQGRGIRVSDNSTSEVRIDVTFIDEITGILIDDANISFEIIGDSNSYNATTENGTLTFYNVSYGDYSLRGSGGTYQTRTISTSVMSPYKNITFYLLNSSDSTEVIATVYDDLANVVPGVLIRMLKYDINTNSFVEVSSVTTNYQGEALLFVELDTELYKFILEYPVGTVISTTGSTYIYQTSINFRVNINDLPLEQFFNTYGLTHSLDYDNSTRVFTASVLNTNNVATETCLDVYQYTTLGKDVINSSCVNIDNSSTTIQLSLPDINGTFEAKSTATVGGERQILRNIMVSYGSNLPEQELALYLVALLTLCFALMAVFDGKVALILLPLPVLFATISGIVALGLGSVIGMVIVSWSGAAIMFWGSK